ncbi:hypothetical protein TNCV_4622071 [Trichonephila clavipes]|nr:hypothetical protein TNCV_4622071 [Trichonephila clavipes]
MKQEMQLFDSTENPSPNIIKLCDVLKTIPPTSVEAERAFSAAGLFVIKLRTRLSDKRIPGTTINSLDFPDIPGNGKTREIRKPSVFLIVRVHYFVRGGFVGYRSRASSKHLSPHLPVGSLDSSGGSNRVCAASEVARVGVESTKKPTPDVVVVFET